MSQKNEHIAVLCSTNISFVFECSLLDIRFVTCYTGHSFVVKELYKAAQGRATPFGKKLSHAIGIAKPLTTN